MVVDLTHNNNNNKNKTVMKNTETQSVKRGRPVSTNSARQARLAAWEAKRASGMEVKRGRPAKAKTTNDAPKTPEMPVARRKSAVNKNTDVVVIDNINPENN